MLPYLEETDVAVQDVIVPSRTLRRVLGGVYLAAGAGHSDLGPGLRPFYKLGIDVKPQELIS
ncbi:hypothetical protein [Mesorhizobium sp. M1027]|uniref:hypothetical protein n=1 Tax=Mesorhizobium sp. M1027 TaxID=2957050 RepID=UPI0033396F71